MIWLLTIFALAVSAGGPAENPDVPRVAILTPTRLTAAHQPQRYAMDPRVALQHLVAERIAAAGLSLVEREDLPAVADECWRGLSDLDAGPASLTACGTADVPEFVLFVDTPRIAVSRVLGDRLRLVCRMFPAQCGPISDSPVSRADVRVAVKIVSVRTKTSETLNINSRATSVTAEEAQLVETALERAATQIGADLPGRVAKLSKAARRTRLS